MLETAQVNISIFQVATELLATFISSARKAQLLHVLKIRSCSELTSLRHSPYYQVPVFFSSNAYNSAMNINHAL